MPRDTAPRISRSPIVKSGASCVPTVATGTYAPTSMLTPPQRICSVTPGAISVCVTRTFVILGSGCAVISKIFPITIRSSQFARTADSSGRNAFDPQHPPQQPPDFLPKSFEKKFIFLGVKFGRSVPVTNSACNFLWRRYTPARGSVAQLVRAQDS